VHTGVESAVGGGLEAAHGEGLRLGWCDGRPLGASSIIAYESLHEYPAAETDRRAARASRPHAPAARRQLSRGRSALVVFRNRQERAGKPSCGCPLCPGEAFFGDKRTRRETARGERAGKPSSCQREAPAMAVRFDTRSAAITIDTPPQVRDPRVAPQPV